MQWPSYTQVTFFFPKAQKHTLNSWLFGSLLLHGRSGSVGKDLKIENKNTIYIWKAPQNLQSAFAVTISLGWYNHSMRRTR